MNRKQLKEQIEKIKLQLLILKLQLQIKLLRKKLTVPNLLQPKIVVVHHGGGDWNFERINNHHKNRWGFRSSLGFYAGYQKFIEFTGKLFIARRDNERGAHTVDPAKPGWWNSNSVGICLQGNTELKEPLDQQFSTLKDELDAYVARGFKVMYHGQIVSTLCPGSYLKEWLKINGYIRA